jgi:hypothetical protein
MLTARRSLLPRFAEQEFRDLRPSLFILRFFRGLLRKYRERRCHKYKTSQRQPRSNAIVHL